MSVGYKLKPENVFLILGIVFGLVFLILIPPFQVNDEPIHYFKSYDLSEGNLIPEKSESSIIFHIPTSMQETKEHFFVGSDYSIEKKKLDLSIISNLFEMPLNNNNKSDLVTALTYPPFPYMASALFMSIGKMFNFSPLLLFYMGRLANLLVWLCLVYLAIRITPVHKWIFLTLALMPMAIFIAVSLSADSFTIGISFLSIAMFLKLGFDDKIKLISKREVIAMAVFAVILALSKQGYFLILLLFFIIPKNKFPSDKIRIIIFSVIFFIALIISLGWNSMFSGIYLLGNGASVPEQTKFMLTEPLHLIYAIFNTIILNFQRYLIMFVGYFGWETIPLPNLMVYLYLLFLITISIFDKSKIKINFRHKSIFLLISASIFILTYIYMYLTSSPVGSSSIIGVHSRYFIPIAPLIFLLFYNRKGDFKILKYRISLKPPQIFSIFLILFIVVFLSVTVLILFGYYT
jgi:uncharacterized membrane protein